MNCSGPMAGQRHPLHKMSPMTELSLGARLSLGATSTEQPNNPCRYACTYTHLSVCGAQQHVCAYVFMHGATEWFVHFSIGATEKLHPCLIRQPGESEFDAEPGPLDHEQKACNDVYIHTSVQNKARRHRAAEKAHRNHALATVMHEPCHMAMASFVRSKLIAGRNLMTSSLPFRRACRS